MAFTREESRRDQAALCGARATRALRRSIYSTTPVRAGARSRLPKTGPAPRAPGISKTSQARVACGLGQARRETFEHAELWSFAARLSTTACSTSALDIVMSVDIRIGRTMVRHDVTRGVISPKFAQTVDPTRAFNVRECTAARTPDRLVD